MTERKTISWGVVVSALVLAGACSDPPGRGGTAASASASAATAASAEVPAEAPAVVKNRSGSAIALTMGAEALLVASEDHKALFRVALPLSSASRVERIDMPGAPAQVVALADRVLVTVRDPGLLLELAPGAGGALVEKRRVELAADAWGIAVSPDGKSAVVTSAWTSSVSGVDLENMRVRWSKEVPREPRGVVVLPDGKRAYVSHLVGSALTRIDDLDANEPAVKKVELAAAASRTPVGKRLVATLGYALVTDPEGKRLFAPRHALGALAGWFSSSSWWGATTVDVLRTADDGAVAALKNGKGAVQRSTPGSDPKLQYVDYQPDSSADGRHAPVSSAAWDVATQPRAVVYRKRTRTLLVAGEGDDAVAELDARAIEPALHPLKKYLVRTDLKKPLVMPKTGGAPSGIVMDELEENAYVFSRSTYDVSMIRLASEPHGGDAPASDEDAAVTLAADPLLEGLASNHPKRRLHEVASWGRRLFYSATDHEMSGGMACAGCHPEGRDDGHTWYQYGQARYGGEIVERLEAAPEVREVVTGVSKDDAKVSPGVPRQTPMLAGRSMAVGPFGWLGESESLEARVELGFELHHGWGEAKQHAQMVAQFVRFGLTPPPKITRALTAEEERGRAVFTSNEVGCVACHDPASGYTDRKPVSVKVPDRAGYGAEEGAKFKTPSLLWVVGTPPYFHNGTVATLVELVMGNDDRMGKTNHLSGADKAALIAFLRTL
jgi:cytochrome c peroxidase